MILEWIKDDPVDVVEQFRNDLVFAVQRNRNPFVDYPNLANSLIT